MKDQEIVGVEWSKAQYIQTSENKGEISLHWFLVVIGKAGKNFPAYSPDLPGCVATGKTRKDAKRADA